MYTLPFTSVVSGSCCQDNDAERKQCLFRRCQRVGASHVSNGGFSRTHKKLREDQQVAPDPFAQNKTQWGGGPPCRRRPQQPMLRAPPPKKVVKPKKVAPPRRRGRDDDLTPTSCRSQSRRLRPRLSCRRPRSPGRAEADADGDMAPIGMSVPDATTQGRTKIRRTTKRSVPPKPSAADLESAEMSPQQAETRRTTFGVRPSDRTPDRIPDVIKATEPIKTLQGSFDCSMGPVVHELRSTTYDCNIAATDPDLGIATKVNLGKATITSDAESPSRGTSARFWTRDGS